ncbi:hypothetical protein Pyn_04922 [Prunus yedoensis var. nudiflora]|uniref:Uncharacterized protein n=1 Tax=Prunus yedoensis var. nudiflora TaxID=2094558 RepID=A0A314YFF8_PRUYE|nr:hypothetical protein Pyn_04922 [Prunus yedoensis var. nudiflora]
MKTSLGCCKLLSNHENSYSFLNSAATSISSGHPSHQPPSLAAASIPAAINPHLLVAQEPQQPSNHFPSSLRLLQAFQRPSQPFLNHHNHVSYFLTLNIKID